MSTEISWEQARLEDLESLLELTEAFYAEEGIEFDRPNMSGTLTQLLGNSSFGAVWFIFDGSRATTGYCVTTRGFSVEHGGTYLFIDELFVVPPFRRQGIATRTLDWVVQMAKVDGCGSVHLEVDRNNVSAQQVYLKSRFVDHGRCLLTKSVL